MAYIQLIYTCAIFLTLVACNENLFTEGRKLNPKEQVEYKSTQGEKAAAKHGSQAVNSWRSREGHGHGYDLPAPHTRVPVTDHTIGGKKDILPSTKPGHSPGVGHSFAGQKKDDVQKNTVSTGTGASHSMAGNTDDVRPKGHSPGVGHLFRNTNVEGSP